MRFRSAAVFFLLNLSVAAQALCVRNEMAYLRVAPSAKSSKSWTVGKYMPLLEVDRKGNWVKVRDVDGQEHWGYASLLTQKERCVVVRSRFTYLRTGPGTNYPKAEIEVVDKYRPFKRLGRQRDWIHVEDDYGRRFWVWSRNTWEALKVQKIAF